MNYYGQLRGKELRHFWHHHTNMSFPFLIKSFPCIKIQTQSHFSVMFICFSLVILIRFESYHFKSSKGFFLETKNIYTASKRLILINAFWTHFCKLKKIVISHTREENGKSCILALASVKSLTEFRLESKGLSNYKLG